MVDKTEKNLKRWVIHQIEKNQSSGLLYKIEKNLKSLVVYKIENKLGLSSSLNWKEIKELTSFQNWN